MSIKDDWLNVWAEFYDLKDQLTEVNARLVKLKLRGRSSGVLLARPDAEEVRANEPGD